MIKRILVFALALVLALLLSGCMDLFMSFYAPGSKPEYKLPKLSRGIEYAPGDESRTVADVYEDMKLELPEGVGLIDYDTSDFIVWAERFENSARKEIESTIFYYDGEDETRSVRVMFSPYDVERIEGGHEDGYKAGNIFITVGEEEPMTKAERMWEAEEAIKTVSYNPRIYTGWNEDETPKVADPDRIEMSDAMADFLYGEQEEDSGFGAMPGFLTGAFEYLMSRFGPFGPFGALILILTALYWTFFRWYKLALLNKYGFKVMGIPAKFTMICYFAVFFLPSFGIGTNPISTAATGYNDAEKMLLVLAIGAVGIIWQAINGLVKTGNLFLMIFHIPLMYIVCFFMGYLFAGYVLLLIVMGFFAHLFVSGGNTGGKCPKCGTRVSGAGDCPNCGTTLI